MSNGTPLITPAGISDGNIVPFTAAPPKKPGFQLAATLWTLSVDLNCTMNLGLSDWSLYLCIESITKGPWFALINLRIVSWSVDVRWLLSVVVLEITKHFLELNWKEFLFRVSVKLGWSLLVRIEALLAGGWSWLDGVDDVVMCPDSGWRILASERFRWEDACAGSLTGWLGSCWIALDG